MAKKGMKKSVKITIIIASTVLGLILAAVGAYAGYYTLSYHRVGNMDLTVKSNCTQILNTDWTYKAVTYNIGFGAYTEDFGFFMDGGKYGRAASKESVKNTVNGAIGTLLSQKADIYMIEEVDFSATRSYRIDQQKMIEQSFSWFDTAFAQNYDSPYLIYPFNGPLGAAKSGLMTLSDHQIDSAKRVELPVETSFYKHFDLDRCYMVSRMPVANGKQLVVYTVHLSAYTSDGKIVNEQFRLLAEDMQAEYLKGNYVLCGGDFNKDLLIDSTKYFGISGEDYTWAQPLNESVLEGKNLSVARPVNEENPIPSCRNADGPYNKNQFVITIDGFVISDNITLVDTNVIDTGFKYSDHNPVYINFILNP